MARRWYCDKCDYSAILNAFNSPCPQCGDGKLRLPRVVNGRGGDAAVATVLDKFRERRDDERISVSKSTKENL
jgi:Zn finger protein HypA/HybF involved in hydrogenase expression